MYSCAKGEGYASTSLVLSVIDAKSSIVGGASFVAGKAEGLEQAVAAEVTSE